jgi:hypothetical protein
MIAQWNPLLWACSALLVLPIRIYFRLKLTQADSGRDLYRTCHVICRRADTMKMRMHDLMTPGFHSSVEETVANTAMVHVRC